jgi:hypothetical protein
MCQTDKESSWPTIAGIIVVLEFGISNPGSHPSRFFSSSTPAKEDNKVKNFDKPKDIDEDPP